MEGNYVKEMAACMWCMYQCKRKKWWWADETHQDAKHAKIKREGV